MDRITLNTQAVLQATFVTGETATDPDSDTATVTIHSAASGTDIVTAAATTRTSAGTYSYTLAPQSSVDLLTITWTGLFSTVSQSITTQAEIVGNRIVSLAEARTDPVLANVTKYPTATLERLRVEVEDEFEIAVKRSFIPKYGETTVLNDGSNTIALVDNDVSQILALQVGNSVLSQDDISNTFLVWDRFLQWRYDDYNRFIALLPLDVRVASLPITAKYRYGLPFVASDVKAAAIKRMRSKAVESNNAIPDRAVSFSVADGGTYSLATPGRNGWLTGIPDVDAVLTRYSMKIPGVG